MNGRNRILVVDDDQTILAMYSDVLKRSGFEVVCASSAHEGIDLLISNEGKIDMALVDIMMARMNGWEMLDYVRKEMGLDEYMLPVIVMSAVGGVDLEMEYMRHRANDWVTKPVRPISKLVHKVRRLLGLGVEDDEDEHRSA